MDISIRAAKLNDLTPMLELFVNCVHDVCKKDYEPNQLETWASAASNSKRWIDKIL